MILKQRPEGREQGALVLGRRAMRLEESASAKALGQEKAPGPCVWSGIFEAESCSVQHTHL